MQGKLVSILFCLFCLVCLTFAGTNYEELFKSEQIRRHVEIRRELEKDATPFLGNASPKMTILEKDATSFLGNASPKMTIAGAGDGNPNLKSMTTSWMDFFTTFSLIDLVMGIFSVVALGLGTVYFGWRMNPFADKVEK